MADMKRRETKTVNTDKSVDGAVVSQQTSAVHTSVDRKSTVVILIWFIYGFIAILLGIRMFMKLFGANYQNGFVDMI